MQSISKYLYLVQQKKSYMQIHFSITCDNFDVKSRFYLYNLCQATLYIFNKYGFKFGFKKIEISNWYHNTPPHLQRRDKSRNFSTSAVMNSDVSMVGGNLKTIPSVRNENSKCHKILFSQIIILSPLHKAYNTYI